MVIPEEQPAQPALPIQPEGMRVVCGHCGNTFLVCKPTKAINLTNHRVVHAALCCCAVVDTCILIILHILQYKLMEIGGFLRYYSKVAQLFCCTEYQDKEMFSFIFVEIKTSVQSQILTEHDVFQAAAVHLLHVSFPCLAHCKSHLIAVWL